MQTYIIRSVKKEDLEMVTKIETACFPKAEAASQEALQKRIFTFPECFFVAEQENRLIGFINGCLTDENTIKDVMFSDSSFHNPSGQYQAIFGLDVLPEFQHQGIACALMNHLISVTQQNHRKGLILTCKEQLLSFYAQFGYKNRGISDSTHGNAIWYDMALLFSTP